MIGLILGSRYELVRLRGQGGMGAVYEAIDRTDARRVAVKVLSGEGPSTPGAMTQRFFREARATMGLASPHVVRVFEAAVDEATGTPFMVMEYLEGEDLGQLLARVGVVPPEVALRIAAQACEGVHSAHEARVIHRDIKPGNLFLAQGEGDAVVVKVLDFGIAKATLDPSFPSELEGLTRTGSLLGSPLYMSPEQARGKRTIDLRADVWSLGIVLYRALSGRAPLQDAGALGEFILALCSGPPAPLRTFAPWVPEEIESIVMRALQLDPAERFPTAASMREAIEALLPDGTALSLEALASLHEELPGEAHPRLGVETTLWITGLAEEAAPASPREADAPKGPPESPRRASFGPASSVPSVRSSAVSLPAAKLRRAVAVVGFKNLTGRPDTAWLATAFAEMVTAELAAGEQLRMIGGEQIERLRGDAPVDGGDALAQEALARLGQALGADFVVTGSYLAMPRGAELQIRLVATLHEVASGEALATWHETDTETEILALVSRVSGRLRDKLGVGDAAIAPPPGPAFPAQRGALRFYAEGIERLRKLDLPEARDLLQRAVEVAPDHPLPRATLAEVWLALGHDREAEEQARKAFERSGALRREDRMFVEARLHEVRKDWERALEGYRALYAFFPDDVEYGLRVAEAQTQLGRGKEALATAASLRKLPAPASDDPRIDLAEASAANSLSDYPRELAAAARARHHAQAQGARLLQGRARISEASALVRLGRRSDAAEACREARQIFAEVRDRAGEGRALNRIANIAYEEGRLADAEQIFVEALSIWRDIGHASGFAQALNNIADTRLMQGRLASARPLFEQALASAEGSGDTQKAGLILANLSELRGRQGDLAAARELGEQAARQVRLIGYVYGLHAALSALGAAALDGGDLDAAEKHHAEALACSREIPDPRLVGYSLHGTGDTWLQRGNLAEARRAFEEAAATRRAIGCPVDAAESELSLASLALQERRVSEARALVAGALATFRASRMDEMAAKAEAIELLVAVEERAVSETQTAALEQKLGSLENAAFRLLARIAAAKGRAALGGRERALAMLTGARDEADGLGMVPLACEARLALAELEEAAGAEGAAAALRREVEETATRLGLGRALRALTARDAARV